MNSNNPISNRTTIITSPSTLPHRLTQAHNENPRISSAHRFIYQTAHPHHLKSGSENIHETLSSGNSSDSDESIDSLFEPLDVLAFDTPVYFGNFIPMPWGDERTASLFTSSEPTFNAISPVEATKNIENYFSELISKNIGLVIDLRHPTEINEIDYNGYYSEQVHDQLDFGGFTIVTTKRLSLFANLDTIELSINYLNDQNNDVSHQFELLHYKDWQDMKTLTPTDLRRVGNLLLNRTRSGEHLLVHCMGGSGRTGTLVTYIQSKLLLTSLNSTETPLNQRQDFIRNRIHQNRIIKGGGFVETPEQLNTIYEALHLDGLMINRF